MRREMRCTCTSIGSRSRDGREAPARPEAEVEALRPDHPAQEEMRPLAGGARGGGGQEEAKTSRRSAPKRGERRMKISMKGRKGCDEIRWARLPSPAAKSAPREPCARRRPLHHSKKIFNVLSRNPPVHEVLEARDGPLVPRLEKRRRPGPEHREDARHGRLDRRDAPEREGRGEEGHDFAVRRVREAVREDERVRVEAAGAQSRRSASRRSPRRARSRGPRAPCRAPFHLPTLASPQ